MLDKLRSLFAGRTAPTSEPAENRPAMSIEELMRSFPPMVPVLPPSEVNDDLEAEVYEAAERELVAAGMLDRRHG